MTTTSLPALMPRVSNEGLQLCPITLDPAYAAEWQENCRDFLLLARDGEPLRETLYRVGGMGTKDIAGKPYFLLLKCVEAFYPPAIMKQSRSKNNKHLAHNWCILDQYGKERVVCEHFDSPYLVKDSLLFSLKKAYYNIETGQKYGQSRDTLESAEFLFIDTRYDKEAVAQGILKINKKNGSWDVFPV